MKKIPTEMSIGMILAYDTTLVTPRESSTLLKRGHKISSKDVSRLKNSGVYEVWIDDGSDDRVYEWDISHRIAERIADESMKVVTGNHGISFLVAATPGIILVNKKRLSKFNLNQNVLVITRNQFMAVGEGEIVAAIDVIPLSISKKDMSAIEELASKGIISVMPFKYSKVGLVVTGTEIFEKRKKDKYYEIVKKKCKRYGWRIVYKEIVPDDEKIQSDAIMNAKLAGAEGIIVTGGMSVDPTDKTPATIRNIGARVISYGIPMKPTTMSIVSVWKGTPLFGISAGGIHYSDFNSIDVLFTRLMSGLVPTRKEIAEMGVGGMFWNYNPRIESVPSKKTHNKIR